MVSKPCMSCGGDGVKKPLERLKNQQGALKRCLVCWGSGVAGGKQRRAVPAKQWYSVKFKTSDGAVIRVTLKANDEEAAQLNARCLLNQSLHCEML
jgi:hypothetical protein